MNLSVFGKFTKYFLENSKISLIFVLSIFLMGLFSYQQTPKKYNPTIVAPAFYVSIEKKGWPQKDMMELIAKPLERVLFDIEGVEDILMNIREEGRVDALVKFYVGEKLLDAKVTLRDRLTSDIFKAPVGVNNIIIRTIDPEEVPIFVVSFSSDKLDEVELRKKVQKLKDKFNKVEGLSRMSLYGGSIEELRVEVDLEKAKKFQVPFDRIASIITQNNNYSFAGLIENSDTNFKVFVDNKANSIEKLENLVVYTNYNVNVYLKDIAQVYYTAEQRKSYIINFNKKDNTERKNTIYLAMAKYPSTNIITVTKEFEDIVKELKNKEDIDVNVVLNDGFVASREINTLLSNLLTSIVIVVIVLIIFLDFKASILVGVTIPLTLLCVFILANFFGHTINRITLFALILSMGLLVDATTVVAENIYSWVRRKKYDNFHDNILGATNEVGGALFMASLTTVVAFIPMNFISGMMGPYMAPIPFFVPVAIIFSFILSISIIPWLSTYLLKNLEGSEEEQDEEKGILKIYLNYLRTILKSNAYQKVLFWGIIAIIGFVSLFPAFKFVRFRMLPKADVDQVYVYIDLDKNTSVHKTKSVVTRISKRIENIKYVKSIDSFTGHAPYLDFNGLFKGVENRNGPHQSTLRVNLDEKSTRDLMSEEIATKIRKELIKFKKELNLDFKVVEDPPGPPVMSTINLKIQSENYELAKNESKEFFEFFKKVEGTVDHDISVTKKEVKEYILEVDKYKAVQANVSSEKIIGTIKTLYSGDIVSEVIGLGASDQTFITVRVKQDIRKDIKYLDTITIQNDHRINVPLSKFIKVEERSLKEDLQRETFNNTIYLTSEMEGRSVTYASVDILMKLLDYKLKNGDGKVIEWDLYHVKYKTKDGELITFKLGGEWDLTLDVFWDLGVAMMFALLIIYIVLIAQFKSFLDSFLILLTIPLSLIGIMPGFALLGLFIGEYFTATSMIGVIALAGIAVNNSIILLEYINQHKDIYELDDLLVMSCKRRLKPIFLTTLTTILGAATIVFDPVWSGLSWAIITGLFISSVLVLLFFPISYKLTMKFRK
ncbi:MAG: efflux RND transporter permease subunit [Halobacteriovoraceae bacterium]|nr:efflux RND transporter permease subunit [Halobacteriovoraceae bacterium]